VGQIFNQFFKFGPPDYSPPTNSKQFYCFRGAYFFKDRTMKVKVKIEDGQPKDNHIPKAKLEANIKKYYIYRAVQSFFFILPIYFLFLMDNGLTLAQAFGIQAIYMATSVILTIPGGLLADNIGRKKSILLSSLSLLIATFIYSLSTQLYQFIIAEVIFAAAWALNAGAAPAFIYDTLIELDRRDEYKKIWGNAAFITLLVIGIAGLIGGLVAQTGFRNVFYISLIPFFIAVFIPLGFTEPHRHRSGKGQFEQLKDSLIFSMKHRRVRSLILYFAVLTGMIHMAYYFMQPYLQGIGIPIYAFGYIYLAAFWVEALGAKFSHIIENFLGEKKTLISMVILSMVGILFMGLVQSPIGLVFPIIIMFFYGFIEPVISNYINEHVSSFRRATIMSIQIATKSLIVAAASPFLGYLAELFSLQTAILLSALVLLAEFFILMYMLYITKSFEVAS